MDLSPWLILRQASAAMANGRPDDAHRLLAPLIESGHRRAWRAAREVAKSYCQRAKLAVQNEQIDDAWWDLLAAESLNTGEPCVAELRQSLTRLGLTQARTGLEVGDANTAASLTARLRERGVRHSDLQRLEDAARDWRNAAEKAERGEFLPALDDLHRLRSNLPCPTNGLDRFRDDIARRHQRFLDAIGRAQDSAMERNWRDTIAAADEALAVAPAYHAARTLRTKAWQAAYPEGKLSHVPIESNPKTRSYHEEVHAADDAEPISPLLTVVSPRLESRERGPLEPSTKGTVKNHPEGSDSGSDRSGLPRRFILWIDGVGGYLVCTGSRVSFGQAVLEGGPVDIPFFADVSRVHAQLTRDDEGFLVESGKAATSGKDISRSVLVNGKETDRAVLAHSDRVTLGANCQFTFHRSSPISKTARIEMTSGHRLVLPVEGVILMANEVIIGPLTDSHIHVPDLADSILLYRTREGLGVRMPGEKFLVNDRSCFERAALSLPGSFESESLSFSLEPIGSRWKV